ncbi:phage tail tip lysozyme [Geodermatophilus sp. SYSU D00867]
MSAPPSLRRGATGEWVRRLQAALLDAGIDPGPMDGDFGDSTEQAVLDFQESSGLEVDGVVGPTTWDALGVAEPEDDRSLLPDETPVPSGEDWAAVDGDERMRYVMALLVEQYGYPVAGAAGIVGNLWAESGILPQRIEGSSAATPMRARDFGGDKVDFTAEEIMTRDRSAGLGPALPGVGLAQWTSSGRRAGLFQHFYQGQVLGADVLFNMEAQVDYLVQEMQSSYARVHEVLNNPGVHVDDASDEVVYSFEVPGSILEGGMKLPRTDPRVQQTFRVRRGHSQRALRIYEASQP